MPPVFGFHALPKRAETYRHPFTGAVIATPVLDLSSVRGPQGYADRSGYGNWGVPVDGPVDARGVFDEGQKFDGVNDTINCGSNASLDIGGDISAGCWAFVRGADQVVLSKSDNAVAGWIFYIVPATGFLQAYYFAGGAGSVTGTIDVRNRWAHLFFTVSDTVARVFVDGLQNNRGAFVVSDAAADPLYIGSYRGSSLWLDGATEIPQVFSGALSPEQIYKKYLEAKEVPIYYDTFESYAVTPVAKAVGSMCGPYRVLANTLQVVVDAAQKHWVQGGGEGVAQWPEDSGYGTWEFDFRKEQDAAVEVYMLLGSVNAVWNNAAQNGYIVYFTAATNELRMYLVTGGAGVGVVCATDANFIADNTTYRIRIVRRVGGQWTAYIKGGAYVDWVLVTGGAPFTLPQTENTYTAGQFHTLTLNSPSKVSGITRTRVCERPASFPWEFSTGAYAGVVSGSTVWMRCLTAGVTYLPKDLDRQTAVFGLYKGADANVTDICFVASEIGGTTFANQNGYCLRVSADERLQLIRMSGGVETLVAETAAAYVAITTEYQIKITHNGTTNAYNFYIMGGAYADWTATGLGAVLGIHTSSNYWTQDLDADDRITAPQFYADLR